MQFGTKTTESFFSWDWCIHRSKAVQKHKQSFWQHSGLGFFPLGNKFCPYRAPVGVDLVLHWIGYTTCGSGGGFVGFCQNLHGFAPIGSVKSPPQSSPAGEVHGPVHCQKSNPALHGQALLSVMAIPTLDFIPRNSNIWASMRKRTEHTGFQYSSFPYQMQSSVWAVGLLSGGQKARSQMTLGSQGRRKETETRTAKARQILMQPHGQWKQLPLVILSWNES